MHNNRTTANRANAKLSTGPRTEAGKQRSCLNATKHGLATKGPEPAAKFGYGNSQAQLRRIAALKMAIIAGVAAHSNRQQSPVAPALNLLNLLERYERRIRSRTLRETKPFTSP